MAFSSAQTSVGTTATLLNSVQGVESDALVKVPSGGVTVFVGGSDVSTTNGFGIDPGETIPVGPLRYDELYGVVASGTQTVHVLGRD